MEPIVILVILALVLVLVTLIGHGIWVMLAWIFRGGKPAPHRAIAYPAPVPQRPPPLPAAVHRPMTPWQELRHAREETTRLLREGRIGYNAYALLTSAIDVELERLRSQHDAATSPAPGPVAAPAATPVPSQVRMPMPVMPLTPALAPPLAPPPQQVMPEAEPASAPSPAFAAPPAPAPPTTPQPALQPWRPPVAPRPAPAPRPARRPWSEVLAAFMEQKNIRWGELVGGLLIVGCSLALVLSFWSEISQRPVLKFSIFTAVTGALFSLGLYTEHRWKLPHTSRGLLLIATLLVPLNFLAYAALSRTEQATLGVALIGQALAFGLFLWLVRAAAKVITPRWPNLTTAGVMSLSLASLSVRYAWPETGPVPFAHLVTFAAVPLACYLLAAGAMVTRAKRWETFGAEAGHAVLTLLGLLTFSAVFPLGLIASRTGDAADAVHQLAPLVSLAGLPALAAGLMLWRRLAGEAVANLRTAGTAIAVGGVGMMLAGMALAWPDPVTLLPVAAVNAAALTYLALRLRVPAAHWLATACAMLAYLVGFHVLAGHIGWRVEGESLAQVLVHPSGGAGLLGLVVLLGGAAEAMLRLGRRADARAYAFSTAAVAGISLLMLTAGISFFDRAGDAFGSAWVYAAYSVLAFAAAWRTRRAPAAWAGWGLLLAGLVRLLSVYTHVSEPWALALLVHASLAAATAMVARRRASDEWRGIARAPAWWFALAGSAAAAAVLIGTGLPAAASGQAAFRFLWIAAIWLTLAADDELPLLFNAAQVATALAAWLAATAWAGRQPWFVAAELPLTDPRTLQAQASALAALCLAWMLVRPVLRRVSAGAAKLADAPMTFCHALAVTLVVALLAMALYAVAPGVAAEFHPSGAARVLDSGASHAAAGGGAWLFLGLMAAISVLAVRERPDALRVQMLLATAWAVCPLLAAAPWSTAGDASMLRWLCAAYLLAGFVPLWMRGTLRPAWDRLLSPVGRHAARGAVPHARALLLVLGALPVLVLSLFAVGVTIDDNAVNLAVTPSAYAGLRLSLSYAVPLLVLVGVLVTEAVRGRSRGFAVAASLVFNFCVSASFILAVVTPAHALDTADVLKLVQLNAAALSAFALAWMGVLAVAARRAGADVARAAPPAPLRALAMCGLGINVVLIALGAGAMFLLPGWAANAAGQIGSPLGWAALLLSAAAAGSLLAAWRDRAPLGMTAAVFAATAAMIALTVAPWAKGTWLGYHTWMASHSAAAWAMLGLGWWLVRRGRGWAESVPMPGLGAQDGADSGIAATRAAVALPFALEYQRAETTADPRPQQVAPTTVFFAGEDVRRTASRWAAGLGLFSVALALRAMLGDPQSPWWSVGAVLLVSLLTTAIACWRVAPRFLYASALLLNLAATLFAIDSPWTSGSHPLLTLLEINVIALAAPAVAWLVLELNVFRRARPAEGGSSGLPIHAVAAAISTGALALVALVGLTADLERRWINTSPFLGWMALGSTAALMTACLWDRRIRQVHAGLYALGLVAMGLVLDRRDLPPERIGWFGAILLAGYALLTSLIWRARRLLLRAADGVSPLPALTGDARRWLVPANLCVAISVIALAFWSDLAFADRWMRLLTSAAALASAASVGLLAGDRRGTRLRRTTIALFAVGAVAFGWAWMTPGPLDTLTERITHRAAVVIAVLGLTFAVCTVGLRRIFSAANPWVTAGSRLAPGVAAAALAMMLFTIGVEAAQRVTEGRVPMHPLAIGVVIVAFAAAVLVALLVALVPARDPLHLSERGRQVYVYAAEGLAGLLYLHLKLTCPPILPSFFNRFWPLILMAVAFAGVGLGEVFRRRKLRVLYEPFERTGAFLPLLLALAFWAAPSEANYSGVLLAAGAVYGAAALLRRSFAFALLAALAGNGALWYLLHQADGLGLFTHPQLWVIPAALSVLAATELNRDRLAPEQVRSLRYFTLIGIYVSSTADIFLNSASPWLPLVLAALSVAGVLVGVMYRIRPFLFLGTSFLALAVGAMIWNASVSFNWTWLWYVAGIVLGLMIIALFALFEKKRSQMIAMIEGLRTWQ
jgi:hypothetical protein